MASRLPCNSPHTMPLIIVGMLGTSAPPMSAAVLSLGSDRHLAFLSICTHRRAHRKRSSRCCTLRPSRLDSSGREGRATPPAPLALLQWLPWRKLRCEAIVGPAEHFSGGSSATLTELQDARAVIDPRAAVAVEASFGSDGATCLLTEHAILLRTPPRGDVPCAPDSSLLGLGSMDDRGLAVVAVVAQQAAPAPRASRAGRLWARHGTARANSTRDDKQAD